MNPSLTNSERLSAWESSLSAQQSRLWILDQLEAATAAHNSHVCLRLRGQLNRAALEQSIREVVTRHPLLSQRFAATEDAAPHALGPSSVEASLPCTDLTSIAYSERCQHGMEKAAEEIAKPFDLGAGRLFRARLFMLSKDDHLLALVAHQIVCDRRSIDLLATEIGEAYRAVCNGEPVSSPTPQYDEFVNWQKEYLRSGRFEFDLEFWQARLVGVTAGLELPTDLPRPATQSFRGSQQSVFLDDALLRDVTLLCDRESHPLPVLLLTAFICLLHRYTSNDEIVIGSELPARGAPGFDKIVGPLSNTVVLRTDCSSDPSFRELLHQVHERWAEAEDHQHLPFGILLDHLRLPRDWSRSPLFQIMFSCTKALEPCNAAGVLFEPVGVQGRSELFDLSFLVTESAKQVGITFSYSTDLFEDSTVARLLAHFQTLLQAALANPEERLSQLSLLTPAQRHQILIEWNNTQADYPTEFPLHKYIEDQVARTPNAPALIAETEVLTYRKLNDRANQLAHHLRKLGVKPDSLVGVCTERSVEMVVALLGTMKAGGAYVPLDPEYPSERLQGMLEDAQPAVVLAQQHLLDRLPPSAAPVICLDRDWKAIAAESTANPSHTVSSKNLAYTIYTSGSTGRPKGVPNVHEGIVNRLLWMQDTYKLNSTDRVLQKTPYSFDVSVWEFFWPLLSGACLVMARPGGHKDPYYLIDVIAKQKITTLHFVPSMLSIFLEGDGVEGCRSIRRVFASGEALPYELQQRFFERLAAELHNLYGPTEAAVDVTFWECRRDSKRSIVPIGRPVANTQIYILDKHLNPVPIGVGGELHIGGRQLAQGYLNRPELTAEKFIADPFSDKPEARLYKTGDLARFLPDGNIEYLGRIDHQVKLRGFRIELGEIESALLEYPGVRQAVVILREDVPGDKRLVAYLALTSDDQIDHDLVRKELRKKLPEFMIPSALVVLATFPMTTSGKVDRKALPAPHAHRATQAAAIAPRNQTETLLVSLFKQTLHLDTVSVNDDFFDLGGHSLLAAHLLSEIHRATGKRIALSLLFRGSSPEFLARVIDQGSDSEPESTVTVIQDGDDGPPFFAVVPPGENAVGYIKLARLLGQEQRFFKLQRPGPLLVGRPYTWEEMDKLATQYVDAMRSVQPEGPYYIGGMCDGAHLAIRMAKKVEELGQSIGMLAIFDTWVLENSQRRWAWTIDYYGQRIKALRSLPAAQQSRAIWSSLAAMLGRLLGRAPRKGLWGSAYWPGKQYSAPIFNGRVTLFKRPKQPYVYKPDPEMGWGARARGGVDIEILPIHHAEMLHEPSVQVLAERLRTRLPRTAAPTSVPPLQNEAFAVIAQPSSADVEL